MNNPFYLLCVGAPETYGIVEIDLDESRWATTYAHVMRAPGDWHLVRKQDKGVALSVHVTEGEQPYYTGRSFGSTKTGDRLVRAYGIGKKLRDGSVMRLWVLENNLVCGGDDVDDFAVTLLHS